MKKREEHKCFGELWAEIFDKKKTITAKEERRETLRTTNRKVKRRESDDAKTLVYRENVLNFLRHMVVELAKQGFTAKEITKAIFSDWNEKGTARHKEAPLDERNVFELIRRWIKLEKRPDGRPLAVRGRPQAGLPPIQDAIRKLNAP